MTAVETYLHRLQTDKRYHQNIVSTFIQPEREAIFQDFPAALNPAVIELSKSMGIKRIYQHQAEAISEVMKGRNVVISTGVASGKSLCYQLPILNDILADPKSRALLIYPTKALAQDQAHKLGELSTNLCKITRVNILSGIYDGDTPTQDRSRIRSKAQIIFSNPDMLHLGILPHHSMWTAFISRLRYVVIDEVHYYRGVFGSHFANVLRRLKRICKVYRIKPVFICTSATLANAQELAEELLGEQVVLIDTDASPAGERINLIYNPPLVDKDLGIRRSTIAESASLARLLLQHPLQGILFSVSRRSVEMLLLRIGSEYRDRIASYRSGYLPSERRKIEEDLRLGKLGMVISTNALELGIDIGGLDVAIINGYPGTISAVRQEAGRAGRKANKALSIMLTGANPLDQYICHHPEFIWDNNPEHALIDPDNTEILLKHLHCAVSEMALRDDEDFGTLPSVALWGHLSILAEDGKIRKVGNKYVGIIDSYPAAEVSLRNASSQYPILAEGECIAYVDEASAQWMTHEGAIYLHGGESWIVDKLDAENSLVRVSEIHCDYYTQALQETEIIPDKLLQSQSQVWGRKYLGRVHVHTRVTGFKKIRFGTLEVLGTQPLDLPTRILDTVAWWIALSPTLVAKIRDKGLWNSDPNDYGKSWPKIRESIRARDGYACASCGSKENGKAFDVHHKVPFRKFADAEAANHPDNLITLCPRCHHLAEQRVRIQSGMSGLAFLLWNLAPFFVMCDPSNLGMHSEIDSDLAEGNPIIALFDMIPGGIGLSKKIYQIQDKILKAAWEQVSECKCESGCPACVGPVSENGEGAKAHAKAILEELIGK
jgi:DEAD/DEAH box helicase domain-containing protein